MSSWFPAIRLLVIASAISCGRAGRAMPSGESPPDRHAEFVASPPPSKQAASSVSRRGDDVRRYHGFTLAEWRERMKSLVPTDPASETAIPGLIALIEDPDVPAITRRQAALMLGRIGRRASAAVPVLIAFLKDGQQDPSEGELSPALWAAKSLALFGPEARAATPTLVRLLRDESRSVSERQAAIGALSRIGGAHPAAVPALIEALAFRAAGGNSAARRQAAEFRELAAEGLAYLGPQASAALPTMIRAADDEDEGVRRRTVSAIGAMGESAAAAIPVLMKSLASDESLAVRDTAAAALGEIGAPAIPALEHLLADRDDTVRLRAARALGNMGEAARRALPVLKTALDDERPVVRLQAAEALWNIGRESDGPSKIALELLASRDRPLRIAASRLLVEIAPHDANVIGSLRELAESKEPRTRRAAEETLEKIERTASGR